MVSKPFPAVIRRRVDFEELFKKGRRIHASRWLILNYKNNTFGHMRLGLTVPRFVGNAVVRNRLKRWCREYARKNLQEMGKQKTLDANVVFRKQTSGFYKQMTYEKLSKTLEQAFNKIR